MLSFVLLIRSEAVNFLCNCLSLTPYLERIDILNKDELQAIAQAASN